jgi:protocatechuate 4,5-dioxygenase beta chain
MARIVGGIATSDIPSIGKAIARGLQNDSSWKPFVDGYKPVQVWLDEVQPWLYAFWAGPFMVCCFLLL